MLRTINHPDRPAPMGYSHAVEVASPARMLFISGQVGMGADGPPPESVTDQARLAVANLNALLEQAGMTNRNVVKFTIFLTDAADLPAFMAGAGEALPSPPPASTLLIVKGLADPALKVEIEAIAVA